MTISRISRATDNVFVKLAIQDVNAFLARSDYPDLYNRGHLQSAMDAGWQHYADEPDLLHKTTDRGMTFSIHPMPPVPLVTQKDMLGQKPYFMSLHSPEGASQVGEFDTLPQAMKVQEEIARDPRKMKDHLRPNPWQSLYIKSESPDAKDVLNAMKASEEAVAAGGDNLYRNLGEARSRRGI